MQISGINPNSPIGLVSGASAPAARGGDDFGSAIKNAVESIDQTQKDAEGEISKAVTGESQDLHKTIIALQTADLKFQLGLQVRNKVIGAYEEIMRMSV